MTREGKPKRHHARPFTTRKQTQHKKHNRIHDTTCNHRKLRSNILSDKSMKTGTAKTASDSASYKGNIENRVRSGFARDFTPQTPPRTSSRKKETFKILSEAILRETSTPKKTASYILQIQNIDSFKETYVSCQRHCLFGMCPHCKGGGRGSLLFLSARESKRFHFLHVCAPIHPWRSCPLIFSGVVRGRLGSFMVWCCLVLSGLMRCTLTSSRVL